MEESGELPFAPTEKAAKEWAWKAYGHSLFDGDFDRVEEEFEECKQDYLDKNEGEPGDDFWFSWVFWVMSMTMNEEVELRD